MGNEKTGGHRHDKASHELLLDASLFYLLKSKLCQVNETPIRTITFLISRLLEIGLVMQKLQLPRFTSLIHPEIAIKHIVCC